MGTVASVLKGTDKCRGEGQGGLGLGGCWALFSRTGEGWLDLEPRPAVEGPG